MIKIRNLKLEYPKRFSLSIDELDIEEGKILALTGPNGAGKTTLLNIIAMLTKPCAGSIEIFSREILGNADTLSFRRRISYVFSQPYLLNSTVFDNICLPLRLRGFSIDSAADNMLEVFNISHLRGACALSLSQGEQHRVCLARAFVAKPELLLLDEPFLSLDANYKYTLIKELRKIIKSNKITAIFVSQDNSEVSSLADSVAEMESGMILKERGIERDDIL